MDMDNAKAQGAYPRLWRRALRFDCEGRVYFAGRYATKRELAWWLHCDGLSNHQEREAS